MAGREMAAMGMRSRQTTLAWARFYQAGVALGGAPECRHIIPPSTLTLLIDSKKDSRVGMWLPQHHEWGTDVLYYPIKRDFIQAGTATVLQSLAPQPQAFPHNDLPAIFWDESHVSPVTCVIPLSNTNTPACFLFRSSLSLSPPKRDLDQQACKCRMHSELSAASGWCSWQHQSLGKAWCVKPWIHWRELFPATVL